MKYSLSRIKDLKKVKELMTDPKLFRAAMCDEDLDALRLHTWNPPPHSKYLLMQKDGKDAGILRYEWMTTTTVNIHSHLLPDYWGSGDSLEFYKAVEKWFQKNTKKVCKFVISTPQSCKEVINFAVKCGFEAEGVLTGAVFWRGVLDNMVLLSKFIRGIETWADK